MCHITSKGHRILPGLLHMLCVLQESPCLPVRGTKSVATERCSTEPNIAMTKVTYLAKRSARAGKRIPLSKACARPLPMTLFVGAASSLYPTVSYAHRNSFGTTMSMELLESSSCICLYRCFADIQLVCNSGSGESSRIVGNDL